jgi:hypothetical protein
METEYSHELGRRHVIQYVATIPQAQAVWCASPSPSPAGQESCELLLIIEILAWRKGTNTRRGQRREALFYSVFTAERGWMGESEQAGRGKNKVTVIPRI